MGKPAPGLDREAACPQKGVAQPQPSPRSAAPTPRHAPNKADAPPKAAQVAHPSPPSGGASCATFSAVTASLLLLAPVEAGAGKAAELDAELLTCCATARRTDQVADAVMDRLDGMMLDDPDVLDVLGRMRPQLDAYFAAVERAAELPARTPEGVRAKAGLLLLHIRSGEDHTALAASLACDVTGRDRP